MKSLFIKMVVGMLLGGLSLLFARPIERLSSVNGKLNHPVIFVHGWNSNMADQFGVLPKPLGDGFMPTKNGSSGFYVGSH